MTKKELMKLAKKAMPSRESRIDIWSDRDNKRFYAVADSPTLSVEIQGPFKAEVYSAFAGVLSTMIDHSVATKDDHLAVVMAKSEVTLPSKKR